LLPFGTTSKPVGEESLFLDEKMLLLADKKEDPFADDLQPLQSSGASTSSASALSGGGESCASSERTLAPHIHGLRPSNINSNNNNTNSHNHHHHNNTQSSARSSRSADNYTNASRRRSRSSSVSAREKWSKRIVAVHILHWVLVGIAILFVVVGMKKWEHDVGVPISKVRWSNGITALLSLS
jgi:hypothetical protein